MQGGHSAPPGWPAASHAGPGGGRGFRVLPEAPPRPAALRPKSGAVTPASASPGGGRHLIKPVLDGHTIPDSDDETRGALARCDPGFVVFGCPIFAELQPQYLALVTVPFQASWPTAEHPYAFHTAAKAITAPATIG